MPSDSLATNEALFREVNERIEAVSQVGLGYEAMEFLCECDRADCRENVNVTRAEYEAVRAVPTHFIVLQTTKIPGSNTSPSQTSVSSWSRKRAKQLAWRKKATRETRRSGGSR